MLEAGIQAYVDAVEQAVKILSTPTLAADHREFREVLAEKFPYPLSSKTVVSNRFIDADGRQIGVRIYRPAEWKAGPVVVFFHGGGFVSGSVFTHDIYAASIAELTGLQVISVNYRLAPENPYPAGLDDCYFVLKWLSEQADTLGINTGRVVIGGDSAGANLAAACALKARDENGPHICFQYLIFPCLDTKFDVGSYLENAYDPFLNRAQMIRFWKDYLGNNLDRKDYYALPLRCPDLSGLPATYVVTAEHDPLRDEGELYAQKLAAAGVPTVMRRVEGAIHGFFRARYHSETAERELVELCRAIRISTEV